MPSQGGKGCGAFPRMVWQESIQRQPSGGQCSPYPFEGEGGGDNVFALAYERMNELLSKPVQHIDQDTTARIFKEIPGLLPRLNVYEGR